MSTLTNEDRLLIDDAVSKFVLDNYSFAEREQRSKAGHKYGQHWQAFAELGWLALPYAEQAGGMGGEVEDAQVLARAFGRGLIAEPWLESVTAGKVLEHSVEPERRSILLEELINGEQCLLLAHGESRVGLNFEHVLTTANKSSSGYILNGVKRVVWQAGAANYYLVTATLDGEAAIFLVDREAQGVKLEEYSSVDSRFAADIFLDDVELSGDALLAQGKKAELGVLQAILFTFETAIGEVRGIADALIDLTADYMRTREQFGAKIGTFQALQHMLANMVIAKEEIQSLEWMIAVPVDDLQEREHATRAAKARVSSISRKLAETAIQIHGGIGLTDEYVVSHYLRRLLAIDALYGDGQQQLLWLAQKY